MDGTLYYVHSDLLGSTVAVSDAAGGEVGRVQYDPYGEVLTSTLPVTLTDRLFTGARFDGTIGLYLMGARWYDPALGRWIQADSIVPEPGNPQALNRYSYVYNNPLRYTDPSGHWIFEEEPGDPYIWYRDKPVSTLIRTAEPVVFWEETREPTVGDIALVLGAPYIAAGVTVAGEVVVTDIALPAAQTAWAIGAEAYTTASIWAYVRGGQLVDAILDKLITWRLARLARRATEQVGPGAQAAMTSAQRLAIQRNPNLAPMFRGQVIHQELSDLARRDILLRALKVEQTLAGRFGPDFYRAGRWWDLTTPRQWAPHVRRYEELFGMGTRIPYPWE